MEEEAFRVFQRADIEGKGFLVKQDMQRFQHEVSLSADQLDSVFESLDACATGFLTLDQFLAGFSNLGNGTMMGKTETQHDDYTEDCHNNNTNTNSDNEKTIKNIINMDMLNKSASPLKKFNSLMIQESPGIEIEKGWLQFVQDLGVDMQRLKEQIEELERVLAARDKRHEIEVQKLFDEFETQLTEEKERISTELAIKERTLRQELKEKIESKDLQISEALNQRDEVLERLYNLQVEENNAKIKNISLVKLMAEQKEDIKRQQSLIGSLQEENDSMKKQLDAKCKKHFEKGFFLAQKLAMLEEEGLLQQLKIIKEMQKTLQGKSGRRKSYQSNDQLSTYS